MRIWKLQDELGTLVKQSQDLEEMEEDLGTASDIVLEQELGKEAWCVVGEEPKLKSQPTPDKIQKLEEELGVVSSDHKRRKVVRYEVANVGAGIGDGIKTCKN